MGSEEGEEEEKEKTQGERERYEMARGGEVGKDLLEMSAQVEVDHNGAVGNFLGGWAASGLGLLGLMLGNR